MATAIFIPGLLAHTRIDGFMGVMRWQPGIKFLFIGVFDPTTPDKFSDQGLIVLRRISFKDESPKRARQLRQGLSRAPNPLAKGRPGALLEKFVELFIRGMDHLANGVLDRPHKASTINAGWSPKVYRVCRSVHAVSC